MNDAKKIPALEPRNTVLPKQAVGKVVGEFGGAAGPEPTRYGDWEHKGRCTDF